MSNIRFVKDDHSLCGFCSEVIEKIQEDFPIELHKSSAERFDIVPAYSPYTRGIIYPSLYAILEIVAKIIGRGKEEFDLGNFDVEVIRLFAYDEPADIDFVAHNYKNNRSSTLSMYFGVYQGGEYELSNKRGAWTVKTEHETSIILGADVVRRPLPVTSGTQYIVNFRLACTATG